MELNPALFFGKVMHKRLFPKVNGFNYGIYYLTLPLSKLSDISIARNRFAAMSFYESDHGPKDGSDLEVWARDILKTYNVNADGEIVLIAMPRIFGYVFNPVSFWMCFDRQQNLRAVICEVNNTFGETHSYLCAHADSRPIEKDDVMTGQKLFHVSPFLKREGYYTFRFDWQGDKFGTWIDFYGGRGDKQLLTSLMGKIEPMTQKTKTKAFWGYPLVTFKAIALIHWQAFKLVFKGIKYISKPKQIDSRVSGVENLNKNAL
ncbi:MAG: DUF1365 domain-containing protein [Pseudomonadota bacterium]